MSPKITNKTYCKNFYCDYLRDRYCCVGCRYFVICKNPCWNDPSRCGLEDTARKALQDGEKEAEDE